MEDLNPEEAAALQAMLRQHNVDTQSAQNTPVRRPLRTAREPEELQEIRRQQAAERERRMHAMSQQQQQTQHSQSGSLAAALVIAAVAIGGGYAYWKYFINPTSVGPRGVHSGGGPAAGHPIAPVDTGL